MADSNIIREFLVGIGFKVDDASQVKFKEGVEGATKETEKLNKEAEKAGKSALALGAAILATGAIIGRSAFNLASKLEDLHFASQRTGAAASSLKALSTSAEDVGVSSQEALSSVEGLARFMRNTPGGEGLINDLGVKTRDTNGHLRDTVDILNDIGAELSKKKEFGEAKAIGSVLGINENLLWGMRNQKYFSDYSKYKQDYAESGVDKRSGQAHDLMGKWRDLVAGAEGKLGTVGLWGVGAGATAAGSALAFAAGKSAIQKAVGSAIGKGVAEAAAKSGTSVAAKAASGAAEVGATGARFGLRRLLGFLGPIGTFIMGMTESKDLNVGEADDLARRRKLGITLTDANGNTTNAGHPLTTPYKTPNLADTAFGRLIARGEGDYGSVNLGKQGNYRASTVDLSSMTVAEVMKAQASGQFNAAGRYQITKGTLSDAVKFLGLSGNEKFDKATQDRIFEQYLVGHKRRAIGDYLSGRSEDLRAALLAAAKEWASVADPRTGRSYYDGIGNNKASIGLAELEAALKNSRAPLGGELAMRSPKEIKIDARQDIKIQVTGSGTAKPQEVAEAISNEQQRMNADLQRNLGEVVS
ncbi:glucosaminidase [Pandoraea sp. CB10b_02]|uniref:glucosaminidase n=1 Tax=Pandoraea sp. CB10b_02 TaxID=2014535 RepID=UPI00257D80FD|nr:glucosaminidase [Pandoraea sp. CB10b_02]